MPKVLGKVIPGGDFNVADADKIEMSDSTTVQTTVDALITAWKFNSTVIDATNPGASFVAFNNADKDSTTIVSFSTISAVGNDRFDEFLSNIHIGSRIWFHERPSSTNSILFLVTGQPSLDGTKVNVPVIRQRDQGGNFTNNSLINVTFLPTFEIVEDDLRSVTLPVNAAYDAVARVFFGGATIQTDEGSDRVEYVTGYSQGVDYRDNAAGTINDDTHYVDVAAGISISSNLASSTISYATGTTFQRLIAIKLKINSGNNGTGAMLVLLTDPGGSEREFVHVNLENKIEVDTDPESEVGTHTVVSDGAGEVVIDDGSWLILELVPRTSPDLWEVIPAILKSDGTRVQCNNINVDLGALSSEDLGVSRSANQRGQITEYKTIQLPGYLSHNNLSNLFDHIDEKWCIGFARLLEGTSEQQVTLTTKVKAPVDNTLLSRDISKTAIGGTGDSVLTLPDDYTSFETVMYTVVEDGGQTTNHHIMTRQLEENASINPLRISGNDTAVWDRTNRTVTLHETTDTWTQAVLAIPRAT